MGWRAGATPAVVRERQSVQTWRVAFGVAAAATFDGNEPKRLGFPNGWRDTHSRYAVVDEVVVGDRQSAVVVSTVVAQFGVPLL